MKEAVKRGKVGCCMRPESASTSPSPSIARTLGRGGEPRRKAFPKALSEFCKITHGKCPEEC